MLHIFVMLLLQLGRVGLEQPLVISIFVSFTSCVQCSYRALTYIRELRHAGIYRLVYKSSKYISELITNISTPFSLILYILCTYHRYVLINLSPRVF